MVSEGVVPMSGRVLPSVLGQTAIKQMLVVRVSPTCFQFSGLVFLGNYGFFPYGSSISVYLC